MKCVSLNCGHNVTCGVRNPFFALLAGNSSRFGVACRAAFERETGNLGTLTGERFGSALCRLSQPKNDWVYHGRNIKLKAQPVLAFLFLVLRVFSRD